MITYQVDDFPGEDKTVKSLHELLDTSGVVPVVDVEEVDVSRPQFLERSFDVEVERLGVVATIEDLLSDGVVVILVAGRILCSEEELIANASRLCPLADSLLGRFLLAKGSWRRLALAP